MPGSWRKPGTFGLTVLVLYGALVVATAIGPAPILVPSTMATGGFAVFTLVYRDFAWKHGSTAVRLRRAFRPVQAFYGFGDTTAEAIFRPKLVWLFLTYPLLPLTLRIRIEVHADGIRSVWHPGDRSPVRRSDQLRVTVRYMQAPKSLLLLSSLMGARPGLEYRVVVLEDEAGNRVRLAKVAWSNWRNLVRLVDPRHDDELEEETW